MRGLAILCETFAITPKAGSAPNSSLARVSGRCRRHCRSISTSSRPRRSGSECRFPCRHQSLADTDSSVSSPKPTRSGTFRANSSPRSPLAPQCATARQLPHLNPHAVGHDWRSRHHLRRPRPGDLISRREVVVASHTGLRRSRVGQRAHELFGESILILNNASCAGSATL